jgi:hypothetical protein
VQPIDALYQIAHRPSSSPVGHKQREALRPATPWGSWDGDWRAHILINYPFSTIRWTFSMQSSCLF